jgi:hypothetical protein
VPISSLLSSTLSGAGVARNELVLLRDHEADYVCQFQYLLPEFTERENNAIPLLARGDSRGRQWKRPRPDWGRWPGARIDDRDLDGKSAEVTFGLIQGLYRTQRLTSGSC